MSSPTQQQTNTPDYLSTLGLDRAPFLDQIDDHFFYADPVLMQRLDLLQHLTRFGDMLLGVTGPIGSGKTTLLRQFLLRGNNTWRSCIIQGGQIKQSGELLSRLADCFGQDMTATPEKIRADLIRHCQALQHNSQLTVIVIDDAHLLPDPALKALLDLGGDARQTLKLFRVLLFGEPGLEQKLIAAGLHSLQQPLLHSLEIPRFDEHQTAAYLMYRLAVAGFSGDSPFSLTEIRALHKAAEGLPGKLNVLAHETLIERANRIAARKKAGPVSGPTPASFTHQRRVPVALVGLGAVLVLGVTGWYLTQSNILQDWLESRVTEQELTSPAPAPAPVEPDVTPQPKQALNGAPETELGKILDSPPENEQPIDNKSDNMLEVAPVATQEAVEPSTTAAPLKPLATPEPVTLPTPPLDTEPAPVEPTLARDSTTSAPVPAESAASTIPPTAESSPAEPAAGTVTSPAGSPELPKQVESAPGATPVEPQTTAAVTPPPPAPAPANTTDLQREPWLLERPAEHFTLQLLGVRSEASLQGYLKHNKLPGPLAYFHTQYKGGDWYVLVQGDYPTIAAAHEAVAALPAAVRKAKPWPRTFANVQADIHKSTPLTAPPPSSP